MIQDLLKRNNMCALSIVTVIPNAPEWQCSGTTFQKKEKIILET